MALSPMMAHYLSVKEQYKDCILFYRLGDFYEMFFEDAEVASEILDLVLTGKNCGLEERAPMCGVPFHAVDSYIAKLVSAGKKVAICEQLSEPDGKCLVSRDVVKIVTAGTVTNNEYIDDKSNNFICSVFMEKNEASVSWCDITTGDFFSKKITNDFIQEISDVLVRINPSEIIANSFAEESFREMPLCVHGVVPKFQQYLDSYYSFKNAEKTLLSQFGVSSLEIYDLSNNNECVCSSGALVSYLKETQRCALKIIDSIKIEKNNEFLVVDLSTVRNLELVKTLRDGKRYGSLLWVIDKTKTSMGARKLNNMILTPLKDKDKINYRLDAVNCFYNNALIRNELSNQLSQIKDIGRLAGKISNGNFMPKDCLALCNSLEVLPNIKFNLLGFDSKAIIDISNSLVDFSDLVDLIKSSIVTENTPSNIKEGGYIKEGFNQELDELNKIKKNGSKLVEDIVADERNKTGIKNLKSGYNRVYGYYLEVTNSFKDSVPYYFIRKQTLINAERYTTPELSDLESKILSSNEKIILLEEKIYSYILKAISDRLDSLKNVSDNVALLDVFLSFATVAKENKYVKPNILDSSESFNIVDGRHPVIEKINNNKFISNNCFLDNDENRTMIITGPNMAGKSTFMRQNALISIMAQIGCFVPASSADLPIVDRVFTRIGASDSLISDQSTFMVEMNEVAYILKNATLNSLIILDEIGRGTSTYDGLSIAWAVVEYINEKIKAKTLFSTHYHELTELEGKVDGIKNYKVTVKELPSGIVFLRKIIRGGANKSFGIEVAELAGVNKEVISNAKNILKSLQNNNLMPKDNLDVSNNSEYSDVERIISELNVDNLTPINAFNIILDLKEKIKEK